MAGRRSSGGEGSERVLGTVPPFSPGEHHRPCLRLHLVRQHRLLHGHEGAHFVAGGADHAHLRRAGRMKGRCTFLIMFCLRRNTCASIDRIVHILMQQQGTELCPPLLWLSSGTNPRPAMDEGIVSVLHPLFSSPAPPLQSCPNPPSQFPPNTRLRGPTRPPSWQEQGARSSSRAHMPLPPPRAASGRS